MNEKIVLYSTNCPKCQALKIKLDRANIPHKICTDVDTILKLGEKHNITTAPILQVNNTFMDFDAAIKFINDQQ